MGDFFSVHCKRVNLYFKRMVFPRANRLFLILLFASVFYFYCTRIPGYGIAHRVILIGADGVTAEGMEKAGMMNLKRIMSEGAYTMAAFGIESSQKAPIWATILCGAGPEQHSVDSNDWTITQRSFEPTDMDYDGYFPNIIYLVHERKRRGRCGIFYDWPGLINLVNLYYLNAYEPTTSMDVTLKKAMPFILQEEPVFAFLYLGHADEMRITYGAQSPQYIDALKQVDAKLGVLMNELRTNNINDYTHILIVSGHGGTVLHRDGKSSPELVYPWIAWGSGIRQNHRIQSEVHLYDTAATIAHLFGLQQPPSWIGRPVNEIFKSK
ncbi:alkaline phosphatase family protein [candidate division KSB1 bacterium]|nr:alkaline phosphatase family protein [candidate division KSB1 bacterium]